jgi:SpoVK/Ycf46/Vps4 family AAA+-type ATPase
MPRVKVFNVKVECTLCDFSSELKSIEKNVVNIINLIIKYHTEYSPDCTAVKDNFSVEFITDKQEEITPDSEARNLVDLRLEETENLLSEKQFHLTDFIGNDEVKQTIKTRLENYVIHKERLKKIKKFPISGLILAGIQGTGKSEILCALVDDTLRANPEYNNRFNIIIMKSHDFMASHVGESGNKVESILDKIREINKEQGKETVLIIDEIDNLTPDRNTRSVLTSERTGSMLDEFGGMHDDHTIFLMGTTNKPDRIDSEALVAGRFGNPILVNIPTDDERYELFKKFTTNINLHTDIDSAFITKYFSKFTGRDMYYFTSSLQVMFYNKESIEDTPDTTHIIDTSDIIHLVSSSNFRNSNLHNLESIKRLASYYNRFGEQVRGDTASTEKTSGAGETEIKNHFKFED